MSSESNHFLRDSMNETDAIFIDVLLNKTIDRTPTNICRFFKNELENQIFGFDLNIFCKCIRM